MTDLAGQKMVITGAGRGIGRAIALAVAQRGAHVVVNDLDAAACEAVAAECGGIALPGDAASADGAAALVTGAREALGGIDVFFANAGIEVGPTPSEQAWAASWEVNVMAHVRAFEALRPDWLAAGRGRFVVTASAAGLLTMLGSPAYSVSKHAAVGFAEWASMTYGNHGIVVQCLCPQGVRTDLLPTDGVGQLLLGPTAIEPEQVADRVVEALDGEEFYILPHPEVARYFAGRAQDPDRWMRGMRRLQDAVDAEVGDVQGVLGSGADLGPDGPGPR